jgi:hypothetical protein
MKTLARYAVLAAAAVTGLTVAMAPSASASASAAASSPVIAVITGPSGVMIPSPCNGDEVSTAGQLKLSTITNGTHTIAGIVDSESGDGYTFVEVGAAAFNSLASSYTVPAVGVWVNKADPALSFHASLTATIDVDANNAPTGVQTHTVQRTCGL